MFANDLGLYHTVPKFLMSPMSNKTCVGGVDFELVAAATNIGEETGFFEHRYGGLAVEEHPGRGDELVGLSQVSKSELGKFNAGTDGISDRLVDPMDGLEKLNGIGICSARAAGTLVSVMAVVLTIETEDGITRDVIEACNDLAGFDECHAVFVSGSRGRFSVARNVATRLSFSDWWFEIDQQAVGCCEVDGKLVITSGKLVLEVVPEVAKTTTVRSFEERQREGAAMRSLCALRRIR